MFVCEAGAYVLMNAVRQKRIPDYLELELAAILCLLS